MFEPPNLGNPPRKRRISKVTSSHNAIPLARTCGRIVPKITHFQRATQKPFRRWMVSVCPLHVTSYWPSGKSNGSSKISILATRTAPLKCVTFNALTLHPASLPMPFNSPSHRKYSRSDAINPPLLASVHESREPCNDRRFTIMMPPTVALPYPRQAGSAETFGREQGRMPQVWSAAADQTWDRANLRTPGPRPIPLQRDPLQIINAQQRRL
jgi:hypothetical protein